MNSTEHLLDPNDMIKNTLMDRIIFWPTFDKPLMLDPFVGERIELFSGPFDKLLMSRSDLSVGERSN